MERQLLSLSRAGYVSDFDTRLARFLCGLAGSNDPMLFLAAAFTSCMVAGGDVCLDLAALQGRRLPDAGEEAGEVVLPALDEWRRALSRCDIVGRPGQRRPLILDAADRLYFYRYWEIEKQLAESIRARVSEPVAGIDMARLKRGLERLFGNKRPPAVDWQAVAGIAAVCHRFAVISGGPGTGKTTTVARILALLIEQADHARLRISLAAPTGKAAARLAQSIRSAKMRMDCPDAVLAAIPEAASTLHRLLKPIPQSPYFAYCRENPLPCDVLVVDEASMVDIALMSRLAQALEPVARLILVGDRDQLASVEAGSVLGDICDRQRIDGFSSAFAGQVAALTGARIESVADGRAPAARLADSIVVLQHSFRFDDAGGIGRLSRAINAGDAPEMWDSLMDGGDPHTNWQAIDSGEAFNRLLAKQAVSGYRECLSTGDPAAALERFERFKILCALRGGPMGVGAINESVRRTLVGASLLPASTGASPHWYRGRPVLMTRNDYSLGLFNGDMGIALPDPEAPSQDLFVFFPGAEGSPRQFSPYRLSEHETAFAMTVHKSQGSEFEDVLLVLPEHDSPVLTRELLYTAVTRARRSVTICGSRATLEGALARRSTRASGLSDRLWGRQH